MDNLCKNCIHWERDVKKYYKGYNKNTGSWSFNLNENHEQFPFWIDVALHETITHNYGHCSSNKFVDFSDELEIDQIGASNYDDGTSFYTGENFGCVHFK